MSKSLDSQITQGDVSHACHKLSKGTNKEIFGEDEWISKVARNADEASELVEAGFEFICSTPDDFMVFRKRK